MTKHKSNNSLNPIRDIALFSVGMGLLGSTASSLPTNSPAQNMVGVVGTVYAVKMLDNVGRTGTRRSQDRSIWD